MKDTNARPPSPTLEVGHLLSPFLAERVKSLGPVTSETGTTIYLDFGDQYAAYSEHRRTTNIGSPFRSCVKGSMRAEIAIDGLAVRCTFHFTVTPERGKGINRAFPHIVRKEVPAMKATSEQIKAFLDACKKRMAHDREAADLFRSCVEDTLAAVLIERASEEEPLPF